MRWLFSTTTLLLLSLLVIAVNDQEPVRSSSNVRLTIQIQHVFNGAPLRMNEVSLMNGTGNRLSISRLAYLISGVTLTREDGTRVRLAGQYAYLNPAELRNAFTLAEIPPGGYVGLSFHVGLESSDNHGDPARYPAGHPLNPLVNHLHWGWQGGYVFLALEGRYLLPNHRLGGFSCHLATDKNLMTVTLPCDLVLTGDSALSLQFDLAEAFRSVHKIALRPDGGEDATHSAPGDLLARRLADNVEHSFHLQSLTLPVTEQAALSATERAAYPPGTTPSPLAIPAGFPQPSLPLDNPLTLEGIALGKRLFFEKRLSGNDTLACASCHRPSAAFSDGGKTFSVGIDGKPGTRHAMPLFNLAWSGAYTWDGRRLGLRDQALAPIQDTREMHQSLPATLTKLRADRQYPAQFSRAFGSPGITPQRLSLALEQYLLTLVSADSKFDRALRSEAQFTDQEKRGLQLFITEYDPSRGTIGADCFHCHGGNLFSDYQYKNNGLDSDFHDLGRGAVTGQAYDRGRFKTPSLRNVALTAPYMHDGRYKTLEEVIDHYSTGIHYSATLDPNLARQTEGGINLSQSDKQALIAFLKTLTDDKFCSSSSPPN